MTIITKAFSEKKASDKMERPLFVEENSTEVSKGDVEEGRSEAPESRDTYFYASKEIRIRRVPYKATFLLFSLAITILSIGVIGGLYIYKQYGKTQMQRFRSGWLRIAYDSIINKPFPVSGVGGVMANSDFFKSMETPEPAVALDMGEELNQEINNFFKERLEIDLENEHYEKIDVPDFRGGRQGRFIHDFNINKTGIIDIDGQCCFVMPLNRERVLPPRNLYDLLKKMNNGYYEVDTAVVRETMKVVTPPITDMSILGRYIARECHDMPTYMLTKVYCNGSSSVVKRSASSGVFGQFAGNNILEVDIVNLEDSLTKK
ncbi:integral membrane protein 2B [Pseudomyrmex gracilis]|uniref:integral membrane protein 2B n=1 Tax=Pseudomyrmex gracilis TaxID=219809 RepID=UPI000994F105|nr:integral membrane protein 2B [Pseudomyrmex gracilis]